MRDYCSIHQPFYLCFFVCFLLSYIKLLFFVDCASLVCSIIRCYFVKSSNLLGGIFRPIQLKINAASFKSDYCYLSEKARNVVLNYVKSNYAKFFRWPSVKHILRWTVVIISNFQFKSEKYLL